MHIFFKSLFLMPLFLAATNIYAEHIIWRKQPIQITLPVAKERLISFQQAVSLGYNNNVLLAQILRVQNDNKTLYLLAKQAFSTQRFQAKLADGHVVLLDINAKPTASDDAINIVLPQQIQNNNAQARQKNITSIDLTRFAIQQLYAPARLLTNPFGITRYPMAANRLVPLVYDGSLSAMPLVSWRSSNQFVTAVLLKNRLPQRLHVSPNLFCGDWQAASFYPITTLSPHGTDNNTDTTTAFFVSTRAFSEAIKPCYAGE